MIHKIHERNYEVKTYIFDIDGTLANTDHRNHHLAGEKKKWKEWYLDQRKDVPYWEIVDIMKMAYDNGIKIVLCTGRDENNRPGTLAWFEDHGIDFFHELFMRPANDRRDDTIIKKELLDKIREKGYDPVCVFEDRDRVVKMWRDEGLRCLQVKPGEY